MPITLTQLQLPFAGDICDIRPQAALTKFNNFSARYGARYHHLALPIDVQASIITPQATQGTVSISS